MSDEISPIVDDVLGVGKLARSFINISDLKPCHLRLKFTRVTKQEALFRYRRYWYHVDHNGEWTQRPMVSPQFKQELEQKRKAAEGNDDETT